jgi:hypothetical protein
MEVSGQLARFCVLWKHNPIYSVIYKYYCLNLAWDLDRDFSFLNWSSCSKSHSSPETMRLNLNRLKYNKTKEGQKACTLFKTGLKTRVRLITSFPSPLEKLLVTLVRDFNNKKRPPTNFVAIQGHRVLPAVCVRITGPDTVRHSFTEGLCFETGWTIMAMKQISVLSVDTNYSTSWPS